VTENLTESGANSGAGKSENASICPFPYGVFCPLSTAMLLRRNLQRICGVQIMKSEPDKHDVFGMWLDNVWIEKGVEMICTNKPKERMKEVQKWLEEILANPQHCSCCGALKYDFVLDHDGKEYRFALWKITDKSKKGKPKLVAESDYKKLGRYLLDEGRITE